MSSYILGRDGQCNIVIDDSRVSRKHLEIEQQDADSFLVKDLGSANGTFINGVRIISKVITASDEVLLGSYPLPLKDVFDKVRKLNLKRRTDFSAEMKALYPRYAAIKAREMRIKKSARTKPMIIKGAITLAAVGISAAFGLSFLIAIAGIIGGFVTVSPIGETNLRNEIELLTLELDDIYKCPKCNYPLREFGWATWMKRGGCRSCDARWQE